MRKESRTIYFVAAWLYAATSFLPFAHSLVESLGSRSCHLSGCEEPCRGQNPGDRALLYEGTESHRSLHDPQTCIVCVAAATAGLAALEPPLGGAKAPDEKSFQRAPEPSCVLASSRAWLSPPARGPPALS